MIYIVDKDTATAMLRDSFEFWGSVVRAEPELDLSWQQADGSDGVMPKGTAEAVQGVLLRTAMLSKALQCGQASCVFESDGTRGTIAYSAREDGKVRCLFEMLSVDASARSEPRVVVPEYQRGILTRAIQRAAMKASACDEADVAECQRLNYIVQRYKCQLAALQLAMTAGISMVDVCLEGDVLETVGYRRLPTGELLEVAIDYQREIMGL